MKLKILPIMLLAACSVDRVPERDAPAADTTTQAAQTETARWFAAVPDSIRLRRNVCPFECCVYGEWRAREPIPVYATQRATSDTVFSIPANAGFRADSGNVHVTGGAIIAVLDTVTDLGSSGQKFGPGDTLVVLDYIGEGQWNVWHRGRVVSGVSGFWGAEATNPRAALIGDYQREWWVHATHDGRRGWFRADSAKYSGADACSG